jgi:hypothetical protein
MSVLFFGVGACLCIASAPSQNRHSATIQQLLPDEIWRYMV